MNGTLGGFQPSICLRDSPRKLLTFKGTANQNEFSVMAMGFIIAGHETHHRKY